MTLLWGSIYLEKELDIPEVSLVAIFDADKQGFLRNERSLLQTIGRAARNENGKVILYADGMSPSMSAAIQQTLERRARQEAYNSAHGIIPKTIKKHFLQCIQRMRNSSRGPILLLGTND